MEELSIEQKAIAYDKAIEKAKSKIRNDKDHVLYEDDVIEIFPELAESEDERMKEAIIATIHLYYGEPLEDKAKEMIAWLEKQGEQNLANFAKTCKDEKTIVIIPKFRVGDVIRPKGSTAEYTIESISGECYHGKGWGLHISCDNDYELVEQKPAEWNEEEEQTFIESVEALEDFGKFELADWLKEHKNKFLSSQSHWKPSDEQIKAVRLARSFVTDDFSDNPTLSEILIGLEEQLKKLKEE